MVPPPPPPPPPEAPSETVRAAPVRFSLPPTTHGNQNHRQQHQTPALFRPAVSPCATVGPLGVPAATAKICGPPTPPWRKRERSPGNMHAESSQILPTPVLSAPPGEQQQKQGRQHCGVNLNLAGPLEDPYALAPLPDPYALSSCCIGRSNCFNAPVAPPKALQLLETVPVAAATATAADAAISCLGIRNSLPVLLHPPVPHEGAPPTARPPGPPSCSSYMHLPLAPIAARQGEEEPWVPCEAQPMRQRYRGRQRREGALPPGVSGAPPSLTFAPQCCYPPQQQHHQQPDRALLALRRTCYRCRRRGHEASECSAGQGQQQMRATG